MNLKTLVIGSNSFSGSHFVAEALRAGHQVWGVSRSQEAASIFLPYRWTDSSSGKALANSQNFSFEAIDLNKQLATLIRLIDEVQPAVIVNFAAQGMVAESWLNPTDWYQTNVVSQVALHDELRHRHFVQKYLHVTTPEVYGSTDEGWIRENNHFSPSTPYAVSRAACDMHLRCFHEAYGFPVVFTRAANVYGPGQQLYRIIPRCMIAARTGKPMKLHGGGYSQRCFVHVRDAMRATLKIAYEADPGTTWHISSAEPLTIRNLAEKIFNLTNTEFSTVIEEDEERLGKDQSYLLDSTAIRETLKWCDEISLDIGLAETLNWIDENWEEIARLPWIYKHRK